MPNIPVRKTLVLFGSIFFGIQFLLLLVALILKGDTARVEKEIAVLESQTQSIAEKKLDLRSMKSRLKEIQIISARPFYWASLLSALSHSMTKGVWLRSLSLETAPPPGGKILKLDGSVIGQGQETAYVGKFIESLKANVFFSDVFSDIMLSGGMTQKKIQDVDVYDFVLVLSFKKEKLDG